MCCLMGSIITKPSGGGHRRQAEREDVKEAAALNSGHCEVQGTEEASALPASQEQRFN